MGKAKKVTIGFKYFLGMHMGICRGPIDALLQIKVGDRLAWSGELQDNTQFRIDAPDLFGGTKGEGGIQGDAWLLLGRADQTIPGALRNMLVGLVPEFRGTATLFYDGMVSAMNPYPKPWKFKVRRLFQGWDGPVWYSEKLEIVHETQYVDDNGNAQTGTIRAMNGVHIVYEACVNRVWGRGMPASLINDAAFRYAADLAYDEKMGLCLAWKRTDNLDTFVQKIIDTMGATLFVDKETGLMTIKMIRNDYQFEALPVFTPDSGLLSISECSVTGGSGILNELVGKFHSPLSNQEGTVRSQNLAGIQTANSIVSDNVEFPAVPTAELAQRLTDRDLNAQALPLRGFKCLLDHRGWKVQPGSVFRIQDPKRGGVDIAIRVGAVEEAPITDGNISIAAIEDVFAMPVNGTAAVQPPQVNPPNFTPTIARRRAYEIPYALLNRLFPEGEFNAIQPQYGYYGMAAEKPTGLMMAYDLAMRSQGQTTWDIRGNGDFVPVGALSARISYLDTAIAIYEVTDRERILELIGECIMLGDEVLRVDSAVLLGNGEVSMTVARGVYDTVPAQHFAGTLAWFFEDDVGSDWMSYSGGEVAEGKELPWSLRGGRYPVEAAPIDAVTMNFRFYRPYAPGFVFLNNQWRWFIETTLNKNEPVLTISWNHRDRVSQGDVRVDHEQGDIGPEPESSYLLVFYNEEGQTIRTEAGVQGKQYQYLWAQAMSDLGVSEQSDGSQYPIVIRLWSRRNGMNSWQYYQMRIIVEDVPTYLQLAQLAVSTAQRSADGQGGEDGSLPTEGLMMAQNAQTAAQTADYSDLPADGVAVSSLSTPIGQTTLMQIRMDAQVFEAPYLELYRESLSLSNSRPMAVVARPSDRLTDGYQFWSSRLGEGVQPNWQDSGGGRFTPWVLTSLPIGYLDTELSYSSTSESDGIELLGIRVGDLALIDKEIIRVDSISNGRIVIGRGVADTVPAMHYRNTPVWFFQRDHGMSAHIYNGADRVGVKLRPDTFTTPYPLDLVNTVSLDMSHRPVRPYPPGQVLIDGHRWFQTTSAYERDENGISKGRAIGISWAHRNRLSQAGDAIDHMAGNIGAEPGVRYRVWIGYVVPNNQGGATKVTLRQYDIEGTGFTYQAEWAEADGNAAGRHFNACGTVTVQATLFAVRDGLLSWQGYSFFLTLPSFTCPIGQQPGGGNQPNPTDPTNPGPGEPGEPTDPTNPQPPDPVEPVDPTIPDPTDPVDPDWPPEEPPIIIDPPEPPDPDFKGSWSYNWDHGWANTLPPTI